MKKSKLNVKKMVLCAILASLAFVLNTFVYFPAMALFSILWMWWQLCFWAPGGHSSVRFCAALCA